MLSLHRSWVSGWGLLALGVVGVAACGGRQPVAEGAELGRPAGEPAGDGRSSTDAGITREETPDGRARSEANGASAGGPGEPCGPSDDSTQPRGDGRGTCREGLLCCVAFHGGCGGAHPMPGEEREPCHTSNVCAAVERCWGPPP